MNKKILIFFTIITLSSCIEDSLDCSTVLCAAGEGIRLELINNGENVIANGTYTEENISVTGEFTENLQVLVLPNTQGATEGLLVISNFDWQAGNYDYTVQLGEDWEIDLQVTFSITGSGPCCGSILTITDLSAGSFAVERTTNSSFYTIILE